MPTADFVFSSASALAMTCWLALAASPFRKPWAPVVRLIAGRIGVLGMPHLLLIPLLALTLMFGPAGLLAFAALRAVWLSRHPQPQLA